MLNFAGIVPHSTMLIPEADESDTEGFESTIRAFEKIRKELEDAAPDYIIMISPHGPVFPDRMSIRTQNEYFGNLASFGLPEIDFDIPGDIEASEMIIAEAQKSGIPTIGLNAETCQNYSIETTLDHGTLVPAYFLLKNLPETPIIPISFSYLSLEEHFRFGEALGQVSQQVSIAIITSANLSHTLSYDSPEGYTPQGKEFDERLMELLKSNKVEEIKNMDPEFIEAASECGFRSILILLGALSKSESSKCQILSYDDSSGIGHLVANYRIKS